MAPAHGSWWITTFHIAITMVFVYGLLRPVKRVECRSAGAAQAFVIEFHAEMCGLPLTMHLVA